MTHDAFERCLIRFGADLDRWPADLRAQAQRLLAQDAAARALLEEEATLDRRMARAAALRTGDTAPAARVSGALSRAALPRQSRGLWLRWLPSWLVAVDLGPAWPSIAALAGMALLGFLVGLSGTLPLVGGKGARGLTGTDVSAVVFEPGPIGGGVL